MKTMEECPELDLLQQVASLLKEKVRVFETCVRSEYIDGRQERRAQQVARREMERLEETRALAEHAILSNTDVDVREQLKETVFRIIGDSRTDVLNYQTAMIIFDARQDEYNQSNIVARQFMTPRTRFARAWEDEEKRGPSSQPAAEVNFFAIIIIVFATLATVSLISSRVSIAAISRYSLDGLKNIKAAVLEVANPHSIAARMKGSVACRLSNCQNWISSAVENATKLEL